MGGFAHFAKWLLIARKWYVSILAIMLGLVLLAAMIPASAQAGLVTAARSASAAGVPSPSSLVLDVVMLVDESGSETDAKVADERQTAGTIAQTMLNPHSRVTVVGFGGVNGVAPDQDPVNVACQPTIASGAVNLAYLASCVNSLHRRTEAEGDDTDYAAALGQAMSYFNPDTVYGRQSPRGATKVILMMTDGGVDVHRDTKQYGTNWLQGVKQAVNEQLVIAQQDGVQVWPLGFGSISPADYAYLQYIAAHGAQTTCDNRPASRPRAMIVQDPANALPALDTLYAAASCSGSHTVGPFPVGSSRTLQVTIPAIASDAAISVARGNPGIQVRFQQPGGAPWTNISAISGTGTPVEVLHLVDPDPGTWSITLTAPPSLAGQLVSATVFWQGAVDALMTAYPSSAQPGESLTLTLTVLGAKGPITDFSEISQLQTTVSVSGDGLSGPAAIPVSNAGDSQSGAAGFGGYQGTFTAPRQFGTLTFTGAVAGYGLYATQIPATVDVVAGAAQFQATVQLPMTSSVQAGQSIRGNVYFVNKTGASRSVRLLLSVTHGLAAISSPGGPISVRPGSSRPIPFVITFARNSPLGPALVQVAVVNAANPRISYGGGAPLTLTVTPVPGIWSRYQWYIIGLAALLILAILVILVRRARRRVRVNVRGLRATIRRNGEPVGTELKPPGRWSETFYFVIRGEDGQAAAHLDYPRPGEQAYSAQRAGDGKVRVVTPAGVEHDFVLGSVGETLPNGLQLVFRDAKATRPGTRPNQGQQQHQERVPPNSNGATTPAPAEDDRWYS
jgi:hypothetical protein